MAGLVPIPNTRISQLLARERLLSQLQGDQLDLLRLQDQVSTGRRISRASEDPSAAQRAITLQRLLERKEQLRSNVVTGYSFLAASDTALTDVSTLLGGIRGAALGAAATTATEQERQQVAGEVNDAINALVGIGNSRYLGRYLFAGSQTNIEPYAYADGYVRYSGNTKLINDFSDIDVLFTTNAPGHSVFGGFSAEVLGDVDLNPHLSADTLLSSLRGGHGISAGGALQISDGTSTVVVDISRAVTVGDVARLIEANAPAGRTITVDITGQGLTLQLDASGGGNLTVAEVGSGNVASELGILEEIGVLTNPLVGDDLDPVILKTTRLDDLLGSKARARVVSAGDNNDLLIEAAANGAGFNGVTVQFVDDVAAGNEVAVYNAGAGTLTIHIEQGVSNANAVVDAINTQGTFRAQLDLADASLAAQAGTGAVALTATATTAGGAGTTLDLASGMRAVNGGQTQTFDFDDAETVEDLLNILNAEATGLAAEINATATGINLRSRTSGADFQIGENGGQTATQLGVRSFTGETRLDALNYGVGVAAKTGDEYTISLQDLTITTRDGQEFDVDLSTAVTVGDVITAILAEVGGAVTVTGNPDGSFNFVDNTAGTGELAIGEAGIPLPIAGGIAVHVPPVDFAITARDGQVFRVSLAGAQTVQDAINLINAATGGDVVATLASVGNGIQLNDVTGGAGNLTVTSYDGSRAAAELGLIAEGSTTATTPTATLVGGDRHFLETSSVFTTLIRLRDALHAGDVTAIERSISAIDDDIARASFAHAEIGARERALDVSQRSLEDEDVQLRSALSDEIDVDLVEAISNLTARQISLEASLRAMANVLQLSLLNFL